MHLAQFGSWLLYTFGMPGAILVLVGVALICLAWLSTAIGVWGLARRSRRIEQHLIELREQMSTQNRRQQVERLRRDKGRNKPGPHR
jgi:hypothetical protein